VTIKRLLIILIISCLVASFLYLIIRDRQIHEDMVLHIRTKAIRLGDHLVSCIIEDKEISSEDVVHIGEKLQLALQKYKQEFIKGYEIEFRRGDLQFPYGDGKAQCRITIYSSKREELLTLRLKHDKKEAKFHILGFVSGKIY
jgi:hypothetical protein